MLLCCVGATDISYPPKNDFFFPKAFWTTEEHHNLGHHKGCMLHVCFIVWVYAKLVNRQKLWNATMPVRKHWACNRLGQGYVPKRENKQITTKYIFQGLFLQSLLNKRINKTFVTVPSGDSHTISCNNRIYLQ